MKFCVILAQKQNFAIPELYPKFWQNSSMYFWRCLHPNLIPPEFPSKILYPNIIQILHPNIVKNVARIPHDSNVADIMSPTFFVKKCRRRCRRHLKNVADIFTVISVVITRILDGFTGVSRMLRALRCVAAAVLLFVVAFLLFGYWWNLIPIAN